MERKQIGKALILLVSVVGLVICLAVFVWMMGWWPDQLIPWVPFERI